MEVKIIDSTETICGKVSLSEDSIIHLTFNEGSIVNREEAEDLLKTRKELLNEPQLLFVDLTSNTPKSSKSGRKYNKSEEMNRLTKAMAVYCNSSLSKIVGNILIVFNKSVFPSKIFDNKQEALDWLESHR